jgi:hypothetical protein
MFRLGDIATGGNMKSLVQLTVRQPVCLGVEPPTGTHDQILSRKSDCYSLSPL